MKLAVPQLSLLKESDYRYRSSERGDGSLQKSKFC